MATGDLTTTAKVRDYLGLSTNEADAKIAGYVTSSSAWVVQQIGRPVLSATYTELYDGDGGSRLVLKNWPVTDVTSVTVGDDDPIPERTAQGESGWVLDGSTVRLDGYTFTRGTQNVEVVYTAGYAAVPADLEQAVIEHVALRFRDADRQGQASASIAGESVAYSPAAALAYINGVLDTYREIVAL